MKKLSIFLSAMLCLIGVSYGQNKMSTDLQKAVRNAQNNEKIAVIITLDEQFNAQPLERATLNMGPKERRAFFIEEMKQFSERSQQELIQILRLSGAEEVEGFWIFNGISCKIQANALNSLNNYKGIRNLELNNDFKGSELKTEEVTENNRGGYIWNITQINADKVWQFNGNTGYTGNGVIVGVLDSGVRYTHYDLNSNMWNDGSNHCGWNAVTNNYNKLTDDYGQGTAVAGVIAGNGSSGEQTGIAKGSKIMVIKTSNANGFTNETYITRALQFGADHGADVLAMTVGESGIGGRASFRIIMENLLNVNKIPVAAAAGDDAFTSNIPNNILAPGNCPSPWHNPEETMDGGRSAVVCVGATDDTDFKATFSSMGPVTWAAGANIGSYNDYPYAAGSATAMGHIRPDVSAPGVAIKTLLHNKENSNYVMYSGTSVAAAHVAGVMALLLEADPTLTPTQIDSILELSAVPCEGLVTKNNFFGAGRIDAYEAMCMLKNGIDAPTNLQGSVDQYNINITWTGSSNAVSYDIYCNEELIASNVTSTSYNFDTEIGGRHIIYVKANKADGKQSARSKSININVNPVGPMVEDFTATVYGESDTVHLQWAAPSQDLSILQYGTANKAKGNDGYNKKSMTYWGQRYPASTLINYAGTSINAVKVFFKNYGFTCRLYLYKGNANGCDELLYQQDFTPTADWNLINLSTPITIDHNKDLWVVLRTNNTVAYPAAYCQYNGEGPLGLSSLISPDGKNWVNQGDNRSWMITMQLTSSNYTYNIIRDGSVIANNVTSLNYNDLHVTPGSHTYTATTNYNNMVSFPCAPVTVSVQTHYTVTFNPGNGSCEPPTLTETGTNQGIVLPEATPLAACAEEGYVFAGWTTSPVSETEEEPEMYLAGETFHPLQNTTLYAVYSYTRGDASWSRVRSIHAGDSICFVSPDLNVVMNSLTNYGYGESISLDNIDDVECTMTVEDAGNQQFALKLGNKKYLRYTAIQNLGTATSIREDSRWTFENINEYAVLRCTKTAADPVDIKAKQEGDNVKFSCYDLDTPGLYGIVIYRYNNYSLSTYAHEPACGTIVKTPEPNPTPDGIYYQGFKVYVNCDTQGATLRYTTDGTEPTESSNLYTTTGITVSENANTIKVKGFKNGLTPSATVTCVYQFPDAYDNIAAFKSSANAINYYRINSNMKVSYRKDNIIYICDQTAGLMIRDDYNVVDENLQANDELTSIQGRYLVVDNQPMFIPTFTINDGPQGSPVVPTIVTAADVNINYLNYDAMLVRIQDVLFNRSIELTSEYDITDSTILQIDSIVDHLDSTFNHIDSTFNHLDSIFDHLGTTLLSYELCDSTPHIDTMIYQIISEDPLDSIPSDSTYHYVYDTCNKVYDSIYTYYEIYDYDSIFDHYPIYVITDTIWDYDTTWTHYYVFDTISFKQVESEMIAKDQFNELNCGIDNSLYYEIVGLIGTNKEGDKMIYPRNENDISLYHNVTCLTDLEHGSISAVDHAAYQAPVQVTVTPEDSYHISSLYYYTTNPSQQTQIDLTTLSFEMPDMDVTIGAIFEEDEYYTVTFNPGTGICETESLSETSYHSGIVTPAAAPSTYCANEGYTFAGWADHEVTETTFRPELYLEGDTYYPTQNITLYAVFAKHDSTWEKITDGTAVVEGEYIITSLVKGNYIAFPCDGIQDSDPDGKAITLTSNGVPKDSTNLWTIASIGNDEYSISYTDGEKRYWIISNGDIHSSIRVVDVEPTTGWDFSNNNTIGMAAHFNLPNSSKAMRYLAINFVSKYSSSWLNYTVNEYNANINKGVLNLFRRPANNYITSPQCEPSVMMPEFQNIPQSAILEDNYMVEITCATPDVTIYYTTDGSTPDNTSEVYTESFAISETTTVRAIAYDEAGNSSLVAEQTYTFATTFENIAAFKAAAPNSSETVRITGDVTFVFRSGRYIYVCDETAGLLVYDHSAPVVTNTYEEGDIIPGGLVGTYTKALGQVELIPTVNPAPGVAGEPVAPMSVTTNELLSNYTFYDARLITIEDGYFTEDFDFTTNSSFTFKQFNNTTKVLDRLNTTSMTGEANVRYDLTGFAAMLTSTAKGIYPRGDADFVRYYNITCAEELEGGNISTNPDHARANEDVILNAVTETGYQFNSWTVTDADGEPVAVEGNTFVMPAKDVTVTADFIQLEYTLTINVTPEEAGTVEGAGIYHYNDIATLVAHVNEGYKIKRWMAGDQVLGYGETYPCLVTGNMTVTAEFEIDDTEYEVVLTADPEEGGTLTGAGLYVYNAEATVTATANEGYVFTCWTRTVVGDTLSTEPVFTFNVKPSDRKLTAHFELIPSSSEQMICLNSGWNWFSSYIELDENSLDFIQEVLTENGNVIKSQRDGFNMMSDGEWHGSLLAIYNEQMYMVKMNDIDTVVLEGSYTNPEEHVIELFSGWNWIGYPVTGAQTLSDALANMNATEGDIIKNQSSFAEFTDDAWIGSLTELIPGYGYMYKSFNTELQNLVFPNANGKSFNLNEEALTFWTSNPYRFANNLTMVVTVDANQFKLGEGSHEIGAFNNGECRGAARLFYCEQTGSYIAFLTVHGEENESICFRLYDVDAEQVGSYAEETVTFRHDDSYGSVKHPYILHFAGSSVDENTTVMEVYPNPAKNKINVSCTGMKQVRLVSLTGQILLLQDVDSDEVQLDVDGYAAGLYLMNVTTADGSTILKKIEIQK